MGFVLDAIKGAHREQSEDRLTQVFCACFNNSPRFRQLFFGFIGYKKGRGPFQALSQEQYSIRGTACRADILIVNPSSQPAIVVENKVDAPLTAGQLKTYNRVRDFGGARKIALVKHYFELKYVPDWTILHWADFHSALTQSQSRPARTLIDSFIVAEFVQLLEELGMARALVIERKRLRALARFMKTIRAPKPSQPLGSVSAFETATDYLGMLEEIVNQMHEEPLFRKRLGKRSRFAPWLGWWSDEAGNNPEPWLGVEIRLRKAHKGIASLSTAILFNSKRGSFPVQTYTADDAGTFLTSVTHKGNLHFEPYAKRVIAFWLEQLH